MKRLLFCVLAVLFLAGSAQAALTYGLTYYTQHLQYVGTGASVDPIRQFINEVETEIEAATLEGGTTLTFSTNAGTFDNVTNNTFRWGELSEYLTLTFSENATAWSSSTGVVLMDFGTVVPKSDQILFDPVADPVGTVEGTVYYDSDDDNLYVRTTAGLVDLTASAAASTLDAAYDSGGAGAGATIDAADGAVTFSNDDADAATVLAISHTGVAAGDGITVTVANGSSDGIEIENTGTGYDIEGTGALWYTDKDGSIVGLDLDLTGAGGITLQNDGTITNAVDGTITLAEGGEDLSLAFAANTVTLSSSLGVDTIAMGAVDALTGVGGITFDSAASTMTLAATGAAQDLTISVTGAQNSSLVLTSAGTGDDALTVSTSAGGLDITNGGAAGGTADLDISSSAASVTISAAEDVEDAIVINASTGGINITADGAATKDLDLVSTNGSINLTAGENAADAMVLTVTSNTTAGFNIHNTTGSGDASIDIDSTAGGIDIDAAKSIHITSSESSVDAIFLSASAGGIDITAASGGGSENIDITTTGATDNQIILTSSGTGNSAIQLTTTAGGITLTNGGGAGGSEDIYLNSTAASVSLASAEAVADAIKLNASNAAGGIDIDAGTGSINMLATAGAVSITGQAASTLTVTSGADAEDLTISVTGTGNSSLLMSSIGTATDAISIQATGAAGGIDIDTTNDGVISIVSTDALTLQATTASDTEDLSITLTGNTNSSILVSSAGSGPDALSLATVSNGGDLVISSNDKIDMDSVGTFALNAAGDTLLIQVDADSADDDLTLAVVGAQDSSILLSSAGTAADAIGISTSAGGISITAGGATAGDIAVTIGDDLTLDAAGKVTISSATAAADGDILLDAEAASIKLDSGEDVEDAITLVATSGDGGIDITSLGDIDITTTGAATQDITILNTGGSVIIQATESIASSILINPSGAAGSTDFSDKPIVNVGDIKLDDIIDDTSGDITYMVKTVIKTIQADDDAITADFAFDDDAANITEQPVDLGELIPAYAEIVSAQIRCTEALVSSGGDPDQLTSMDLGITTGAGDILATAATDALNEINAAAAGAGPVLGATNAARHVWINVVPEDNWNTITAGRWAVVVTYIDYGAAYTQKGL